MTTAIGAPWRLLWAVAGVLLFALGTLGIFLPLLPTTVFWLAAVACFSRSCPALADVILSHPRYGRPIRDFREHGVICRSGKRAALATMALSAVITVVATRSLVVSVLASAVLAMVAAYIATRPDSVPEQVSGPAAG